MSNQSLNRPSTALIASAIFLILSVAASLVIIRQVSQPAPIAAATPLDAVPAPTRAVTEPAPQSTSVQPTATTTSISHTDTDGIIVGIAPLSDDAAALRRSVIEAVETVLAGALLPEPVHIKDMALSETSLNTGLILPQDMPDADIVLAWGIEESDLIGFYLIAPSEPPLTIVEEQVQPWDAAAPGDLPIFVTSQDELALPAGLMAALLEIRAGQTDLALDRIHTLQAQAIGLPPDAQNSNQAVLDFLIGQIEVAQGNGLRALQTYSHALRSRSDFPAAYVNRGNLYLALGDFETARINYDSAMALSPDSSIPVYNLALALWSEGDFDAALSEAAVLSEHNTGAAWAANLIGQIHYSQEEYAQALTAFEQAEVRAPEEQAPLFNQARTLHELGDYDGALTLYDRLLDVDPSSPLYLLHAALTYQAQGRYAPAQRSFNRAIEADRMYLDAYLLRCEFYIESGKFELAIEDAETALTINPDEARAYQLLGDARLGLEDFEGASEAYTDAIDLGTTDPTVYAARGWSWHRQRYIPWAVDDYEQALASGYSDPIMLYRLGFALLDAGRYEDALEALLGAIDQGIDTPEAHAVLAVALDANLRREEADREYQHAMNLDAHFGEADYLAEQVLWSRSTIQRAQTIIERLSGGE